MSEKNPIEGKFKTQKNSISWKYYFIFSSWLFLCLLSFYLGMGLIDWNEEKPNTDINQASMGEGVIRAFQADNDSTEDNDSFTNEERESFVFKNVLEEIFSSDKKEETKSNSGILTRADLDNKPIRSSTWFSDYEAMKKYVLLYDEIHPFIYSMKGGLTNTGELANSWSSTSKRERIAELRALNPHVKIIPTIFRWENPKEKISENIGMNGRSDIRDKHIQIIVDEVMTYDYDGIDIDYEGMSCDKKEKFEEFVVLLSKELKKRNKLLSVAVHPKTPNPKGKLTKCKGLKNDIVVDFKENWRGPMTHDYEFLAKHVDRLKIMAYELHPRKYHNPGPGPQAPNTWLKEIIRYAKKRVPKEKLYMAIPTYGYDWALNCKAPAKSVYYSDVRRIKELNPTIHQPTNINSILEKSNKSGTWTNLNKFSWVHDNKIYEDPTLWYSSGGCDRVAFYMNRKAFEEKMNLLRKYEVAGFSFWQLISDNDPEINQYLELLVTNKLPKIEIAHDLYDNEKIAPDKSIEDLPARGLKKDVSTAAVKKQEAKLPVATTGKTEKTKTVQSYPTHSPVVAKETKSTTKPLAEIVDEVPNKKIVETTITKKLVSEEDLEPQIVAPSKDAENRVNRLLNDPKLEKSPTTDPNALPTPTPTIKKDYKPLKEDIIYE